MIYRTLNIPIVYTDTLCWELKAQKWMNCYCLSSKVVRWKQEDRKVFVFVLFFEKLLILKIHKFKVQNSLWKFYERNKKSKNNRKKKEKEIWT